MAKTVLLPVVWSVALLAAVPALAQQQDPPTPPAADGGSATPGNAGQHRTHAMRAGRHGGGDTSQNGAVDQLNDQSYQAARQGQSFGGADTGSTMAAPPSGGPPGGGMPQGTAMPSGGTGGGMGGPSTRP